ncbi:hypothetical protein [Stenotrophomonas sp.]|uniref:hypothetical protein n=1 Tax=Stenotrophomonas sp. TaxID=69392 RepID=UPI0028AF0D71|nr:hypothetical protein [Stenotrophomonas sp.]
MNDVNRGCTCPSGGGSLHHPCPAHPVPTDLLADLNERLETAKALGYEDDIPVGIGLLLCVRAALAARQPARIYGCCAQPEGELHTAECPNMRHVAARRPVNGLSWADYWMERGQCEVAHDFEAFCRAEAWALQRFPDARQPVGQVTGAEIDGQAVDK